MPGIETFSLMFVLLFLLLPLVLFGILIWFATSVFRRAALKEDQYQGPPPAGAGSWERYDRTDRYGSDDSSRRAGEGQWRSFSMGPGLKGALVILGLFVLLSLVFAPRFLPGFILFLPLFWVGGWSRTFGPRNSRWSIYGRRDRYPAQNRR